MPCIGSFTPGGSSDVQGRWAAQHISAALGQPVIAENRSGAGGVPGSDAAAKAAPDGYTLLVGNRSAHRRAQHDGEHALRDAARFFAHLSHCQDPHVPVRASRRAGQEFERVHRARQIARTYGLVLVSGMDFPARSVPELLGLAKGRAAKLTYATSGYGNPTHVAGAFFGRLSGIPLQDVQYKGSSASNMQDLVTGRVDLAFLALINIASHIRAGKVRAFALTGSRRSPLIPDVPTFQDLGYKDMELIGVYGLHFRAKVRRERVQRMHQEVAKALRTPEVTKMFNESGMYATGTPPDEFAAYVRADIPRQARLMKELGLKPQ